MSENDTARELERRGNLLIHGHKPKVVGRLTPGIIHELSNPINNILLAAGILQEDYSDLPEEERLNIIDDLVKESERAQKIARKSMDFAGEREAESRPHDVQDIIDDALQMARSKIKRAKVKVKREHVGGLPLISCDRLQLELAFVNIVLNAVEAMPDGGVLTISCNRNADGDSVTAEFMDTGLGIHEKNIHDVFKPFFTTKPADKSDGLGLFISLEIIRQHGGDIRVESRAGHGATFAVRLPTMSDHSDISADCQAPQ